MFIETLVERRHAGKPVGDSICLTINGYARLGRSWLPVKTDKGSGRQYVAVKSPPAETPLLDLLDHSADCFCSDCLTRMGGFPLGPR